MTQSASIFDHSWLSALFADAEIDAALGADAQLGTMREIEAAYSRALGECGLRDAKLAERAAQHVLSAELDEAGLKEGTARDGLVIPELVHQLKADAPDDIKPVIHSGLTSQDVIDTALVLNLRDAIAILADRLQSVSSAIEELEVTFGENPLAGRTRMQLALEITVSDRLKTWRTPIETHLKRLAEIETRLIRLQLGGAVGDRASWAEHSQQIADSMARALHLPSPGRSWHTDRTAIAEFSGWLSLITGTLGKMGQDIVLMAQQGVDDIRLKSGGSSSVMPHKHNPVLAELLVTLARFNATLLPGMHHAVVHEQERSGTAWALEWMLLPQMVVATGRALLVAAEVVRDITEMGSKPKS
ncbi:3-carboxy-cis,cis-muconate cycloisomerase [uncultured Ruegeria sp.]|uniref:3-carboxy-cis,cis-muconate cycloisomerase n=1 Tax=uncultured Ruegeria sp. TaxID=259304 RepID=UPI00262F2E20|nr:3-carboxy-cis,cis-muconate cycloisomerase [uncultured Ruegeria sp.]